MDYFVAESIAMKKIFILITASAFAAVSFVSCNKQTDTKIIDSYTNNNGPGSPGGGGFNWTGTAPFSAKVNGEAFPFQEVTVFPPALGLYGISAKGSNQTVINLTIPEDAQEGKVYSMPYPASGSWQDFNQSPFLLLGPSAGKLKIITMNTTTMEGYFWIDAKDLTGASTTTVKITEGYFKVDKP